MFDDALTIACPAKVNLTLSVGALDPENGLHPICSWMVVTDFGDTLRLSRAGDGPSTFAIRPAEDAPVEQPIDWPLEKDLAFRAHKLIESHVGRALPVGMRLDKRIPSGAGLGGGSSDAAGMLLGVNDLYGLGLSDATLFELGIKLGSDVGFLVKAIRGMRSAIVEGFGERITRAPLHSPLHLVLILPPLQCATAEVYRRYDKIKPGAELDEAMVHDLALAPRLHAESPFNDLAEAAFSVEPALGTLGYDIEESIGWPVHVSGSGSAFFVVVGTREEAATLAEAIISEFGVATVVVVAG